MTIEEHCKLLEPEKTTGEEGVSGLHLRWLCVAREVLFAFKINFVIFLKLF